MFVHDLFRALYGAIQAGETTAMLTRKQFELLRFIQERLKESGVPPSFDEMKDALDLRSKSGIHRLITALEERGFIRRLPPTKELPTRRQQSRPFASYYWPIHQIVAER